MEIIKRNFVSDLQKRLKSWNPLIQVVLGPRQVGKTTGILELQKEIVDKKLYISADDTTVPNQLWLESMWAKAKQQNISILIIDEIQKVSDWAKSLKSLWDKEKREDKKLSLVLLGSSSLDLHMGMSESLAGRFEIIKVTHWNYLESKELAKNISLETYMRYGGYPGSYLFLDDEARFTEYLRSSILESVISRDLFAYKYVKKPALFRQLVEIISLYPAYELSYNKILGQLQDKGNIDLVKNYLTMLEQAFLFKCFFKFSTKKISSKTSSPKIIPLCPALTFVQSYSSETDKGRIFEAMVGSDLLRAIPNEIYYWREGNFEVDYVFYYQNNLYAIEVKSGRKKETKGLEKFRQLHQHAKLLIIDQENYLEFLKDIVTFVRTNAF